MLTGSRQRRVRATLAVAACAVASPMGAQTADSAAARSELADACPLTTSDSAWTASAIAGWERVRVRALHGPPIRHPILVLFDAVCSHTLTPFARAEGTPAFVGGGQTFSLRSVRHEGTVHLPDGDSVPARLVSFTSRLPNGRMFFVMSLPAIWHTSGRGPRSDELATAVFMHEFTHSQSPALGARVDALIRRGLPASSNDDVIQLRFDSLPEFRRAYEAERDLLFEATRAPTRAAALATARRAMILIDRRRARFFRGAESVYADAEDVFLSMEGTGQWAAYLWLTDPEGGAMSAADALPFIRRGGRRWSQDEGLALLLVLSRLDAEGAKRLLGEGTVLVGLRGALHGRTRN